MSSLNQLPLILEMGALELNFQGTPQQIADAMVRRMRIVSQQAFALFAAGSTEPPYNVGPWVDSSTTIGIWKNWDPVTGRYQPMPLDSLSLRYILSNTEPDPTKYQLWVKLSNAGEGLGVYTYYNGAWRDVYANVIATINAAIAAILPPAGAAGTVLTSAGPGNPPVWQDQFFPGVVIDYAGSAVPVGLPWLICDGSNKNPLTYPSLFNAIGTAFGGDGITTFAVPDLRGRGRAGLGTGDASGATPWSLGQKKGAETHQLTEAELAAHLHVLSTQRIVADGNVGNAGGGIIGWAPGSAKNTDPAGGDQPHNNLQPTLGLNAIIRY
jgi:microcystin-dependent protein